MVWQSNRSRSFDGSTTTTKHFADNYHRTIYIWKDKSLSRRGKSKLIFILCRIELATSAQFKRANKNKNVSFSSFFDLTLKFIIYLQWGKVCCYYAVCLDFLLQDFACKTILCVNLYATVASINWMFIQGVYLHGKLTTNVFDRPTPFKVYYVIGWGTYIAFFKMTKIVKGICHFWLLS